VKLSDYRACHTHDEFVSLTDKEINYACRHARKMRNVSLAKGDRERKAAINVTGERIQMLGAVAELAARKHFGFPMVLRAQNYREPDLPHQVEVKMIGADHFGLRVYERTKDNRRVMAVVIPKGCERVPYRLPGWIYAADAKREGWLIDPNNKGPMYAVPQDALIPLSDLRDILQAEGWNALPRPLGDV